MGIDRPGHSEPHRGEAQQNYVVDPGRMERSLSTKIATLIRTYTAERERRLRAGQYFVATNDVRLWSSRGRAEAPNLALRYLDLFATSQPNATQIETRLNQLESAVEKHEFQIEYGVRPALSAWSKMVEGAADAPIDYASISSPKNAWQLKLADILAMLDAVRDEFDDQRIRLSKYTVFQTGLRALLEQTKGSTPREFRHAILTLYDAAHSVYSEELTRDQVKALRDAIEQLRGSAVDVGNLRSIDRALSDVGLETIPSNKTRYLPDDGP